MSAAEPVAVVRTGTANLASVVAALERAGRPAELTDDPERVRRAARVVLPGVGAFGPVARRLTDSGLAPVLKERIAGGRPTLAICLGLQLLAESSEESPGEAGLGAIPGVVRRLPDGVRVPQLGWNRVEADPACSLLEDGAAYFANSFRLESVPTGWHGAVADHGGPVVAAVERGAILACQFHPELSAAYGQRLVVRWLEMS